MKYFYVRKELKKKKNENIFGGIGLDICLLQLEGKEKILSK